MLRPPCAQSPNLVALLPAPTCISTLPLRPLLLVPLAAISDPEPPKADDPVLKIRQPLRPELPPFDVRRANCPLLVTVPSPALSFIIPPTADVDRPDSTRKMAPALLVPLPTVTQIQLPRPAVELPDATVTVPLFPALENPELKRRCPLVPTKPLFTDDNRSIPLLNVVPSPLVITSAPPDAIVLRPDAC